MRWSCCSRGSPARWPPEQERRRLAKGSGQTVLFVPGSGPVDDCAGGRSLADALSGGLKRPEKVLEMSRRSHAGLFGKQLEQEQRWKLPHAQALPLVIQVPMTKHFGDDQRRKLVRVAILEFAGLLCGLHKTGDCADCSSHF